MTNATLQLCDEIETAARNESVAAIFGPDRLVTVDARSLLALIKDVRTLIALCEYSMEPVQ